MKRIAIAVLMVLVAVVPLVASDYGAKGASADNAPTLEAMLRYAIQDEYLARAEYASIMEKYGEVRPFSNIIRSEETHVSYLEPLFEAHNFELPADDAAEHVVVPDSLKEAVEIGVQAEIDNIAMYEKFLDQDLPEDVRDVFEQLKKASQNHLRAFRNNLRRYQ
jgi:hypothetical protein